MYKKSFGEKRQIQFNNEHEFYKFLGYLAKSDGSTSIVWENNEDQGAWGREVRDVFKYMKKLIIYLENPTCH